jgi:hypothetical protein
MLHVSGIARFVWLPLKGEKLGDRQSCNISPEWHKILAHAEQSQAASGHL